MSMWAPTRKHRSSSRPPTTNADLDIMFSQNPTVIEVRPTGYRRKVEEYLDFDMLHVSMTPSINAFIPVLLVYVELIDKHRK